MRAAAIILAAGYSSRMGQFKPLLPIGGQSAIALAASSARQAGAQVFIVTGHLHEKLSGPIAQLQATQILNTDYDRGMFSSIRAGIRKLEDMGCFDGALLWPCDCPLIPAQAAAAVLTKAELCPGKFVVASCGGKNGHPLFIPQSFFPVILSHDDSSGMKAILHRHAGNIEQADTDYDEVLLDMDTPQGYERILTCASAAQEDISPALQTKNIWLLRHGQTERQPDSILMGQCDIPLSQEGLNQTECSAQQLFLAGCRAKTVYTSPLRRAYETARVCAKLLGARLHVAEGLREMSLGAWDGQPIRKIRREFPDEYELRGKELLTYRFDENCENFFDLRRRVKISMLDILNSEKDDELLIVSHLGVIRSLWSLAKSESMKTALSRCCPEKGGWMRL